MCYFAPLSLALVLTFSQGFVLGLVYAHSLIETHILFMALNTISVEDPSLYQLLSPELYR